jgi:hypothetical protein
MKSLDSQYVTDSLARFRRHLALGVALLLLLVAGGTSLALWESHRDQAAEARQAAANVAQALARNVATRLKLADNALQAALMQVQGQALGSAASAAEADRVAQTQQALVPGLTQLLLVDAQGRVLNPSAGVSLTGTARELFNAVKAAPSRPAMADMPREPAGGGWGLMLAHAQVDADGRFTGAAVGLLATEQLAEDFRHADLGLEGVAALRTRQLTLLARQAPGDGSAVPGIGSA